VLAEGVSEAVQLAGRGISRASLVEESAHLTPISLEGPLSEHQDSASHCRGGENSPTIGIGDDL
jgi:hypothetical protein